MFRLFSFKSWWHTSWLADGGERLGARELCQGSKVWLVDEVGEDEPHDWVVELGSFSFLFCFHETGRVLRQFPSFSFFVFWHAARLLFPYSPFFYLIFRLGRTLTQGRLGRLPSDSKNSPLPLIYRQRSTYFHLLLAWPLGCRLAHARPMDFGSTGSRPESAGDSLVIFLLLFLSFLFQTELGLVAAGEAIFHKPNIDGSSRIFGSLI